MDNKKILILADWYLPGYKGGGQIKGVEYIVGNLKDRFDFYILCRDHDADGTVYPDVTRNVWTESDGIYIKYLSRADKPFALAAVEEIRNGGWGTVYINSFFSFSFSIIPLAYLKLCGLSTQAKTILAPRGEFSPGALNIKKSKKIAFIGLARLLGLHSALTWHASTEYEKSDIRRNFPLAEVKVAKELLPAGVELREQQPITKEPGAIKLLFLSRITTKKGLEYALRALDSVKSHSVQFDIYGPIEDRAYWAKCSEIGKSLPRNVTVRYCGELPHSKVKDTISGYHLFIFPTMGENFGYVIIEAILSCRPLLISDRTPWRELETKKIGFDLTLNRIQLFSEKIEYFADMGQAEFDRYVRHVREFAEEYIRAHEATVQDNLNLFNE